MDGSHVALVTMRLGVGLFDAYRCDRTINLGLSMKNMAVALKCAGNDDTCLIRYDESESESVLFTFTDEKHRRKQVSPLNQSFFIFNSISGHHIEIDGY